MTDLLVELWHLVFKRLELADLSACAQVSKKFHLMVKDYRIREIAFTRGTDFEWFHKDSTKCEHQVDYWRASVLKSSPFNFEHLKYLKIGRLSSFELNDINQFTQLKTLDLDLKNYRSEESPTLSLPNLCVFWVFVPNEIPYLELDTPRLAQVHTFHLEKLEFVRSESIQQISTFSHAGNLSILFPNLKSLTFTDYYDNQLDFRNSFRSESFKEFSTTTLKNLKNLKEISFSYSHEAYTERNLNVFKKIIQKVLDMQRPDLKVFWRDLQVTDLNLLIEYQNSMKNDKNKIVFLFHHYEKLKDKKGFWHIGFNLVTKKLKDAGFDLRSKDFASEFLAKFTLRELMVFNRVNEPELLAEFIVRSPSLAILRFKNSGLDRPFFGRLLEIIETNHIPLRLFEIDQQLPPELITKLLRLPQLEAILFPVDKIERLSPGRFRIDGKCFDLHHLLEHLKAKRNASDRSLR